MRHIGDLIHDVEGTCDEHGSFTLRLPKRFTDASGMCPTCRRAREVIAAAEAEELEAQRRHDRKLDAAGLVGRSRAQTFESFQASHSKHRAAVAACRQFVTDIGRSGGAGLWLLGPPGTGKTHLASAIAHAVIFALKRPVIVATASSIVRAMRETWHRESDLTERAVIERFGTVDCLVLDELGFGFGSDGELAQLFAVVDERYQRQLPTVVISNLNCKQLREALGERLYDRLFEDAKVIPCDWSSHRRKGQLIRQEDEERA